MRNILHMDLDTFFVSVERLKDSRLEGKPLIIGGTGDRGVVASCSYEARLFGVHAAMPMRLARRFCPQAIVISGDFDAYTDYSHTVTEIIQTDAPVVEKASIDEFYVDMTGMERFHGCWTYARHMRQRVMRETGLPLSFGLSVNKLVSKVATNEAKPNGELHIPATRITPFLDPLSVRKLPAVGKQTAQQLISMGVRRVHTLREIPKPVLQRAFGKPGLSLYRKARGEDDSPVVPFSERKSISTETTFPKDSIDILHLRSTITHMVEKLAFKLRQSGKLTACITVKIRYANFETFTRQARLPFCGQDDVLIAKALELFDRLYEKRVRIRLVGVRFSQLVPGAPQLLLFQKQARQIDLYDALDQIKHRWGHAAVRRASGMGCDGLRTTPPANRNPSQPF
ncbi:MAG: DNA polymerase IV [Bacteroidota bacterium]